MSFISPRKVFFSTLVFHIFVLCDAVSNSTSTSPSSSTGVGDFIMSGLQNNNSSTLIPTPTVSSISSSSTIVTGSGASFASSCQSALWAWSDASTNWYWSNLHSSTVLSVVTSSNDQTETFLTASATATRITTLCDGFARAVGSASKSFTVDKEDWTSTLSTIAYGASDYPTPRPCSIGSLDCAALWSTFDNPRLNTYSTLTGVATKGPPCLTSGTTDPLTALSCGFPAIVGSAASLLYWPVRTVEGTGQMCNMTALAGNGVGSPLPQYITSTPTGPLRTFVTDGITITSPSVAIAFSGLRRIDNCGPTLSSTIIPVAMDQVMSVRGQRQDIQVYPFNYADLNWRCIGNDNTTYLQDEGGDNCYQDVPADVYFEGEVNWNVAGNYFNAPSCGPGGVPTATAGGFNICRQQLTIINDYRPVVEIPTALSSDATQLWGPNAYFALSGVWDPPHALSEVNSVAGPSGAPNVQSQPSTTTAPAGGITTPASPASALTGPATPTAQSEVVSPTQTAGSNNNGSNNDDSNNNGSNNNGSNNNGSNNDGSNNNGSNDNGSNNNGSNNSGSNNDLGDNDNGSASASKTSGSGAGAIVVVGSSTVQAVQAGSNSIVVAGQTLAAGGAAATVNGQVVSAISANGANAGALAIGSKTTVLLNSNAAGTAASPQQTQIIVPVSDGGAQGSTTLDVSMVRSATNVVVVDGQSLIVGGTAQTIDGQILSAASSGMLVIGTGTSASTVSIFSDPPSSTSASSTPSLSSAARGKWDNHVWAGFFGSLCIYIYYWL